MGSTLYTATIRLPQFGPSDKPSWQGDMNKAFKSIDDALAQRDGIIANMQTQINTLQSQVATLNAKVGV